MRTIGIDCQADGLHVGSAHDLTVEELAQLNLYGPMTLEESQSIDAIISWGDATVMPAAYTEDQWQRVLAQRAKLGRPLDAAEVRLIVGAEDGDDRDL